MAPPLQTILRAELARGNTILEIADWPPLCRQLVILARPFAKRYRLEAGVTYGEPNDPHYWKAEYRHGPECLACRF